MSDPLFIGLLSGTSMDAVDCALVSFKKVGNKQLPVLLDTLNYPIPKEFKTQCLDIAQHGQGSIDDYGYLDASAGELFAQAVLALLAKNNLAADKIKAIGSHGQTLRHRPNATPPYTLQIGDPNIIAERTNIPTIADFRRRDIAAGGQGAPLAPGFHAAIFGSEAEDRVVVNIGGISNLTIIPKDPEARIIGYDAGPGNCLMDAWAHQQWNLSYDKNGQYAARGQINETLLTACLHDEYFLKTPPKSTGREYFNLPWLTNIINNTLKNFVHQELKIKDLKDQDKFDIQATLSALTAKSIAYSIQQYAAETSHIFVCGGGAHNSHLMKQLNTELRKVVQTTDSLGLPPDWIEAVLFAWLAKQTLEGKSGNCPSATGAKHAIPLGGIFGYCPNIMS